METRVHQFQIRMLEKLEAVSKDLNDSANAIETAYNNGAVDGFEKKSFSQNCFD